MVFVIVNNNNNSNDKYKQIKTINNKIIRMDEEILPWTYMNNYLMEAVKSGQVEIVEELINDGAEINVFDKVGNTLLWDAYVNNFHDIVFILLSSGADVNLATGDHKICDMHRACAYGDIPFIELLISCNGNVNKTDYNGRTPLLVSIYNEYCNFIDIANLLLTSGADVNHQDVDGLAVLHYACVQHRIDDVEWLLNNNGDPCLQDNCGFSPLTYSLAFVCYSPTYSENYRKSLKITEILLVSMDYNYNKIKCSIIDTCCGINLYALFDLIFYGLRVNNNLIINIGWQLFTNLNELYFNLNPIANTICSLNKRNDDIIYFLQNIQLNDSETLVMSYISKLPYETNVSRANILLYYSINIDHGKYLDKLLIKNTAMLTQNYFQTICDIVKILNKKPRSLQFLCRVIVRNYLKYSIKTKLKTLNISKNIENFIYLNEINYLNYFNLNANELLVIISDL